MRIDSRLIGIGIFFGAVTILIFYLLGLRYEVHFPAALFFISIALIAGALLYQILLSNLTRGFSGLVILQIALASIVFHYIYQIPTYGLYGTDAYYDLASMEAILESGYIAGVPGYVQITSFFPVIHIMGAELSLVTGIDAFNVAKWFPAIIGSLTIPMIYLLVRHLFKREKAALLAAFLYACIQHYIMFSSLFVRETVGIVLAISCVYFYIAARGSRHPLAYRTLSIMFLAGTIIAHHLTSLMLLVFLFFYWIFTVFRKPALSKGRLPERGYKEGMSFSLFLMGAIGTLTYWLTTVVEPVQIGMLYLNNILTPSIWGTRTILEQDTGVMLLPNLRYYFLIYGSYLIYLIFGGILLYRSFSRRGTPNIETPAFTVYLILCGILGFMSYFVLPPTVGGDRFLAFGWLFAFGPLAIAIIEFKNKIAVSLSGLAILAFIFINLYTIHPTIWNPESRGVGGAALREDFALAEKVDFTNGGVVGYQNNIMTIYEVQKILGTDAYFLLDDIELDRYRWIIVNRPGLEEEGLYSEYTRKIIADMAMLDSGNSVDYNRIYESNNLVIFQRR